MKRNLMSEENPTFSQCYTPETWVMLKDNIYAAQHAIRIGLEHINEHIETYESLRPSRQNLKYLEILKNEKLICEQALEGLSNSHPTAKAWEECDDNLVSYADAIEKYETQSYE